jgi:transcription initiation factor TFIIB
MDESCPECGSRNLRADPARGEVVCANCGLVLSERTLEERPLASYGEGDREREQNGPPRSRAMPGSLSTEIGYAGRDGRGRWLTPEARRHAARLRGIQQRSQSTREYRRLQTALSVIRRTCGGLGLPTNVEERAMFLYREAKRADLIRGRSIEEIAAASVLLAARERSLPRSIAEVADASGVERRTLARAFRILHRSLRIRVAPTAPRDYLPRLLSDLSLPPSLGPRVEELLRQGGDAGLGNGHSAFGLAGAAVYVVAKEAGMRRTEKQVAKAAGVSDVTIRVRTHDLVRMLEARARADDVVSRAGVASVAVTAVTPAREAPRPASKARAPDAAGAVATLS